jgi:hypothetical protein
MEGLKIGSIRPDGDRCSRGIRSSSPNAGACLAAPLASPSPGGPPVSFLRKQEPSRCHPCASRDPDSFGCAPWCPSRVSRNPHSVIPAKAGTQSASPLAGEAGVLVLAQRNGMICSSKRRGSRWSLTSRRPTPERLSPAGLLLVPGGGGFVVRFRRRPTTVTPATTSVWSAAAMALGFVRQENPGRLHDQAAGQTRLRLLTTSRIKNPHHPHHSASSGAADQPTRPDLRLWLFLGLGSPPYPKNAVESVLFLTPSDDPPADRPADRPWIAPTIAP